MPLHKVWAVLPLTLLLWTGAARSAAAQPRPIEYADLELGTRQILAKQGIGAGQFPELIGALNRETAQRLREGEWDHLIYFLLQSGKFTHRAKIEPALSAREFVQGLTPGGRAGYLAGEAIPAPTGKAPAAVKERMRDFLAALEHPPSDERLNWFHQWLPDSERSLDYLCAEYVRAMRFLYQKEFVREGGSSLYQSRGHSSDTRIESSFAVAAALHVMKALDSRLRISRVLIVGPGLDFAPRTDLIDSYPPQSYQPYAVADALLAVGLATAGELRIDCVDINPRVLDFFREFPMHRERRLILLHGSGTAEYDEYFRTLGRQIGTETPVAGGKSLLVSQEAADSISAVRLNVITERYDPPRYDLIVATNVFVYFNGTELLLALDNIRSMLALGGYLIHNELRPEVEELGTALDFGPQQARTIRFTGGTSPALFDSFVIHRKPVR